MSRNAALGIAALVILGASGLVFREDSRLHTPTSFGTGPRGQRALFEVLTNLAVPVERSYEPPAFAAVDAPVWFIEPWDLCESAGDPTEETSDVGLAPFVQRGGTAVVFLLARRALGIPAPEACEALAGVPLPERLLPDGPVADENDAAEEAGDPPLPSADPIAQRIDTDFGTTPRTLDVPPLATFVESGDWAVRATADGEPLVLERAIHGGRVVVVADGTFLNNQWLDGGDAALLALDFIRAIGVPRIDESAHGMRLSESAVALLARLGALPVFLGVLVLGVLWGWRRAAIPQALPDEDPSVAPALEVFVETLATIYGQSRDWSQMAERYRKLSLDRIRIHFGLAPEVPGERLLNQLQAERRAAADDVHRLAATAAVSSRDEWIRCARELDRVVAEVCR